MLHFTKNILQCAFKVTTISLKYLRSFFHNNIQDHLRIVLVTNNYRIIIYQTVSHSYDSHVQSLYSDNPTTGKKRHNGYIVILHNFSKNTIAIISFRAKLAYFSK